MSLETVYVNYIFFYKKHFIKTRACKMTNISEHAKKNLRLTFSENEKYEKMTIMPLDNTGIVCEVFL